MELKQKGPKVEVNKKSLQAKEDEIFVLKSRYSRLLEKFEESKCVIERNEFEISDLKFRNVKLQQELDCKTRNNSDSSVEVLEQLAIWQFGRRESQEREPGCHNLVLWQTTNLAGIANMANPRDGRGNTCP